jgi:hypothetical protein
MPDPFYTLMLKSRVRGTTISIIETALRRLAKRSKLAVSRFRILSCRDHFLKESGNDIQTLRNGIRAARSPHSRCIPDF